MVTCEVFITLVIAGFVNQSLMKIKMKINEISSKVLSKVTANPDRDAYKPL